jgi:hypothetical protein
MRETAQRAFARLKVPEKNRAILCLDGGGIRGIMTIQLLKELEEQAGAPCHEIFDMVAGTSTGGIIAGLVASGRTAVEIEQLYRTFVTKVFTRRDVFASQLFNPPAWSKASYRRILKETLGDVALRDVCDKTGIDLLITAHDVVEGEQTFFSYLRERPHNVYARVLLRGVMEATMSAPTYFTPMERFVDGGTSTYNNPSLAAILEAAQYGPPQYEIGRLTVFSFGTGSRTQLIAPEQVPNPPGPDVHSGSIDHDGSEQRRVRHAERSLRATRVTSGCDYRCFKSRSTTPPSPSCLMSSRSRRCDRREPCERATDEELAMIARQRRASPRHAGYRPGLRGVLARHAQESNRAIFSYDLIDAQGRELLVTRSGDIERIARQMADPAFIDELPG